MIGNESRSSSKQSRKSDGVIVNLRANPATTLLVCPIFARSGMTTSIYNVAAAQPVRAEPQPVESAKETVTKRRHTIASRLVFLTLCVGWY